MAENPIILSVRPIHLRGNLKETSNNWTTILSHLRKFAKYDMVECGDSEILLYFFNKNYAEQLLARDETIFEDYRFEISVFEKTPTNDDFEVIGLPSSDSVDCMGTPLNNQVRLESEKLKSDEYIDPPSDYLMEGLKHVEQSLFPNTDEQLNNDDFFDAQAEVEDSQRKVQVDEISNKNAESIPGISEISLDDFTANKESISKASVSDDSLDIKEEEKEKEASKPIENNNELEKEHSKNSVEYIKLNRSSVSRNIWYWDKGIIDPFFNKIYFFAIFIIWNAGINFYFFAR